MRFQILATDYDGTLATASVVSPSTIDALERLRASGRKCILVTGRELEDLKSVFPRIDLLDAIVAENGALAYYPRTGELTLLHQPPQPAFAEELRRRGVAPLSVGHVIVATVEPHDPAVLDVIKKMGLELEIIFNKGAVMILPTGVNKATGLIAVLKNLGIAPENVLGVGDGENDHALLKCCGCGVAVNNSVPSLKDTATFVTRAPAGSGVEELIDLILANDLSEIALKVSTPAL